MLSGKMRGHLLENPGALTKHADIRALLAALAGSPLLGAASGVYGQGGAHPIESGLGGAAGGALGGATGAGVGAAAAALLQLLSKGRVDPKVLTSAATLAGILGAVAGGQAGAGSAMSLGGHKQEALLAAILEELQGQNPRPSLTGPDLLR